MEKKPEHDLEKKSFFTINLVSGVVLLILSAYVAVHTCFTLPIGSHSNPGPGYMPLLLSILMAAFSLILLLTGSGSLKDRSNRMTGFSHAAVIFACCVFTIFSMERLGYRWTILISLLSLFLFLERLKIWVAVLLACALTFGSFWLFHQVLRVPLP